MNEVDISDYEDAIRRAAAALPRPAIDQLTRLWLDRALRVTITTATRHELAGEELRYLPHLSDDTAVSIAAGTLKEQLRLWQAQVDPRSAPLVQVSEMCKLLVAILEALEDEREGGQTRPEDVLASVAGSSVLIATTAGRAPGEEIARQRRDLEGRLQQRRR